MNQVVSTVQSIHSDRSKTRTELHRIATHIVARRRYAVSGRFGLRASPGGIATPAFGEGPEVLRVSGVALVLESGGNSTNTDLVGSTLRQLADFVEVDLDVPFNAGKDTPPLGDIDSRVELDADVLSMLCSWFASGWRALDAVVNTLPEAALPATIQLWPEHFDAGTNVRLPSGNRVNLGFSPGDSFEPYPYAYVGPWELATLPHSDFWNAPFGAVLRRSELSAAADPITECVAFLQKGVHLAGGA